MKSFVVLILCLGCIFGQRIRYEKYKVFRIHPQIQHQIDALASIQNDPRYDFWNNIRRDSPVDVMVGPEEQNSFVNFLTQYNFQFKVIIDDVQRLIENEFIEKNTPRNMTWDRYYEFDAISTWLDSLPSMYPGKVIGLVIGTSYEGRPIKGVKISFGPGRKSVMFEGGIHAREWISPATMTYMIHQILNNNDTLVRKIAESFDWHIFPVTNPDGYVYTHQTDRSWRKTRTPYGSCYGADPNRNFAFYWGEIEANTNPCTLTYVGPAVFSEKETSAIKHYVEPIASSLVMYLSFHSYGQMFLLPFANTTDHLGNYDDVKTIAVNASNALSVRYGRSYRSGNSAEVLYYSSGTSKDWIKDKYNVPIVFTVEMRDNGTYGFFLPPEQILPNCEEMLDGVVEMFVTAENLGYFDLM